MNRAKVDRHPEPDLLSAIASVISDGAPLESLDKFATWRAAGDGAVQLSRAPSIEALQR